MRRLSVVRRKWNLTENKLDGGMNLLNIHQRQKKKKMEGLPKNVVLGIHKVKKSCSKTFHKAKKQAENVRFADISNLDKKDYSKK